jgi:hypothetical protein
MKFEMADYYKQVFNILPKCSYSFIFALQKN